MRGLAVLHQHEELVCIGLLEDGPVGEWFEEVTFSLVELGLEFDPVKTETMEERGEGLHDAEDADRLVGQIFRQHLYGE